MRYCSAACQFPPCCEDGCDAPRPQWIGNEYHNLQEWRCSACTACSRCGNALTRAWNTGHGAPLCSSCSELVRCASCHVLKPEGDYAEEVKYLRKELWRCQECRLPKCSRCPNSLTDVWNAGHGAPLCSECLAQVVCASCKTRKPESDFPKCTKQQQKNKWKCRDCLQPPCAKCGARPQKPFANPRPRGPYYCSKHQPRK